MAAPAAAPEEIRTLTETDVTDQIQTTILEEGQGADPIAASASVQGDRPVRTDMPNGWAPVPELILASTVQAGPPPEGRQGYPERDPLASVAGPQLPLVDATQGNNVLASGPGMHGQGLDIVVYGLDAPMHEAGHSGE